jgi:hypothetical protein
MMVTVPMLAGSMPRSSVLVFGGGVHVLAMKCLVPVSGLGMNGVGQDDEAQRERASC